MFKSKEDATLALTLVKLYFQDEITENVDYVPASLTMHLGLCSPFLIINYTPSNNRLQGI